MQHQTSPRNPPTREPEQHRVEECADPSKRKQITSTNPLVDTSSMRSFSVVAEHIPPWSPSSHAYRSDGASDHDESSDTDDERSDVDYWSSTAYRGYWMIEAESQTGRLQDRGQKLRAEQEARTRAWVRKGQRKTSVKQLTTELEGSVVVQISDTLFRLHRSRLVESSNFFETLFSKPSLNPGDDIPRYRVDVVSVEDFESLLTILDDMPLTSVFSISFVAAVLRASTALSFPMLRRWANCRLLEIWPSSLHDLSVIAVRSITDFVDVYVLARDMNIPTVFRRASYELAQYDFQLLIQYHRELGQQDISRLTYLRDRLLNAWTSILADGIPCSAWFCLDKGARNGKWMEVVVQSGLYKKRLYDPIVGLWELTELDWSKHGFCANCIAAKKIVWLKRSEDLWVDVATWIA